MKKFLTLICTLTLLSAFAGCKSLQLENIPTDMTPAQLIQAGQDAYSMGIYRNAELYLSACIMRYGTDSSVYVEAKYELGNIYVKTKKYEKAYYTFTEIINMYDNPYGLPPAYNTLSKIGLSKIPEKVIEELK